METIDRNEKSKNFNLSENWQSFDENNYDEQISIIAKEKKLEKGNAQNRVENLKFRLFEDADKHERVQEFIKKNCEEPIEWVDKVVPFSELIQWLIKSAEDENLIEVKRSIESWNAKDQRIYELPVYKQLIEKWFILPSDVRTYYDSANREPVYHLWVDYNVKAWTEVKAIYGGKVVDDYDIKLLLNIEPKNEINFIHCMVICDQITCQNYEMMLENETLLVKFDSLLLKIIEIGKNTSIFRLWKV